MPRQQYRTWAQANMRFIAILAAVAFAVVILGISVVQVRGLTPGERSPDTELVNPNSELSLYLSDPKFLGVVVGQRLSELTTFDPARKAEYRLWLSQERFELAKSLLASGRVSLGLWTLRKSLTYQTGSLELFPSLSLELKTKLAKDVLMQVDTYQLELDEQNRVLFGAELAELHILQAKLRDNGRLAREALAQ